MEENKEKKTVASYVQDLEEYCKKNGIPIPRRIQSNTPMVIIPSKSLAEKFKKHHERQAQIKKEQAQQSNMNK